MKTIILDNIVSEKELFFMYNEIISYPGWRINAQSSNQKGYSKAPILIVRETDGNIEHYPFFIWGQTVIFRIQDYLKEKNIGLPTKLDSMWFNSTHHGKKTQHWLHQDDSNSQSKSILLFMTPLWQPDWRGSFYVDGEEFKFKPGSAVVFDSKEYHRGESPESEIHNWQRITCNIMVK